MSPQTHGNGFGKGKKDFICRFPVLHIKRSSSGVADRLQFLCFRCRNYGTVIDAVGIGMEHPAVTFEFFFQKGKRKICQFANGVDTHLMQSGRGSSSDHEQFIYGQRPHFSFDLIRKKGDKFIWFFQFACHFCKDLITAYPDIYCKSQFLSDPLTDLFSCFQRRPKKFFHACIIQEAFIDGKLFDSVGIF